MKSKSIPPGGLVVTQRQFNKAINVFGERVGGVVKTLEERQDAFENEVRLALLAVADDTAKQVAEAVNQFKYEQRQAAANVGHRRLVRRVKRVLLDWSGRVKP